MSEIPPELSKENRFVVQWPQERLLRAQETHKIHLTWPRGWRGHFCLRACWQFGSVRQQIKFAAGERAECSAALHFEPPSGVSKPARPCAGNCRGEALI